MQVTLLLAVLAAVSLSAAAPREPVAGAATRALLAWLGMSSVALFAAVTSWRIADRLRVESDRQQVWLQLFTRLRIVHFVLWLMMLGTVFCSLRWAQVVRFNWTLDRFFLVDDLLILMPVVLPVVVLWAIYYDVEREAALANPAVQRGQLLSRRQYLMLHARHYFGLLLVPILCVLALHDAIELTAPTFSRGDNAWLIYGPLLAISIIVFPLFLRWAWKTEPLPSGPLRQRLEQAGRTAGFKPRNILVWKTHGSVVNAAVAGMFPATRYVLLSDGLLRQFTSEEIAAVYTHEIAHIRQRHLLLRFAAMLLPVAMITAIGEVFPAACGHLAESLVWLGINSTSQRELLLPGLLAMCTAWILCWYSRRLEYQADLWAAQSGGISVGSYIQALEKLAGSGRNRKSWLHPSISQRVDLLRRASQDSKFAANFHRRMNGFALAIVCSLSISCLLIW